jgi:hypothetical protein
MKGINMNNKSGEGEYVSYFQSVITVGVMTSAHNVKEAKEKAKKKLIDKQLNYCFFDQTPFKLTETEKCNVELQKYREGNGVVFAFNPDYKTKNVIATRLLKKPEELTEDDYATFVKESVELSLKK